MPCAGTCRDHHDNGGETEHRERGGAEPQDEDILDGEQFWYGGSGHPRRRFSADAVAGDGRGQQAEGEVAVERAGPTQQPWGDHDDWSQFRWGLVDGG